MRKLCWASIGFGLAAFAAEYNILPVKGLPFIAAALFGLSMVFFLVHPLRKYRRAAIILLFAAFASVYWWGHYTIHVLPCEKLAGQEITIEARLTDYPLETEDYSRLYVRILDGAPHEKGVLYLYDDKISEDLCPGDIIQTTVTVRAVRNSASGLTHTNTAVDRNFAGYMTSSPECIGHSKLSWIYFPQYIAQCIKDMIARIFPADVSGFMTALMTGDTSGLYQDIDLYNSLRLSGVMHIVAVSGMHISIIAWAITELFGKRKFGLFICMPVLILFVLISGCRAAVIRAAVMQLFLMAGPLLNQESDSRTSLCAALLFLLLINPMAIGGIGLQLSFCCVAGLVYLSPMLNTGVKNQKRPVVRLLDYSLSGFKTTYCAGAFAIIPAAFYFDTISLVSPLSNLITLPIISFSFAAGYCLCLIGFAFLPVAVIFGRIAAIPVRFCLLVYSFISNLPFSCLYTAQAGVLIVFSIILALLFFALRSGTRWNRRVLYTSGAVILCCALLLTQGCRLSRVRGQLTVLDVGQGQCSVLTAGSHTIIIGCGGSGQDNAGDIVSDFLLSEGIRHADAVIIPCAEPEMDNGTEMLLSRIDIGAVIVPADHLAEDYSELAADAAEYQTDFYEIDETMSFSAGDIRCTILYSKEDLQLSLLAKTADSSALFMGDADEVNELEYMSKGYLSDVDYLIVGNFASENSSSDLFLNTIQPEIAILSISDTSLYYPDWETIQRLTNHCDSVVRTDELGDIVYYLN